MNKLEQDSQIITAGALTDVIKEAIRIADLYSDNDAQTMFRVRGISHAVEQIGRAFEQINPDFNRDRFRSDCGLTPTGLPKAGL